MTTFLDEDGEPIDDEVIVTRMRGQVVSDDAVENADDIPLLVHSKTGKLNTVVYIKVTRMDGMASERGYKGRLDSAATMDDLGRKYGNGVYTLEGCNSKHNVIAREVELEVSMPQYKGAPTTAATTAGMSSAPGTMLHAMKMIGSHSEASAETVREMATAQTESAVSLAKSTVESIQTFAGAQRDADRQSHETTTHTMAQFFAAMQTASTAAAAAASAAQATAHAQQMEMLTAMNDRARASEQNPMEMVEILIKGMGIGRENAGDGDEPWVAALRESSGMLGNLAALANSPGAHAATAAQMGAGRAARALPAGQPPAAPGASGAPVVTAAPGATPPPSIAPRKRRAPFNREEIRGIAKLRAELRKRGVSFERFLADSSEHFATIPDSELFEGDGSGGDVEDGSDNAQPSTEPSTAATPASGDEPDEGHQG